MVTVISAIVVGAIGAVLAYWVRGWLFPDHGDLSDITQGFMRLGLALVGFVIGVVLGIVLGILLTRRRRT